MYVYKVIVFSIICALQVIACSTDMYDAEAFMICNKRNYPDNTQISKLEEAKNVARLSNVIRNGFLSPSLLLYEKILTLENCIKERSMTFPIVIAKCFCDLTIIKRRQRFSAGVKSYQIDSYTASPIILLCNKCRHAHDRIASSYDTLRLRILTFIVRYSPKKQYMNASTFIRM